MVKKADKTNKFGPLIFIGIIATILFLIFAVPLGIYYFKSRSQCGSGGMLIGSSSEGWYCGYDSVCDGCQSASECPNCSQLCQSKGKIERRGYCGHTSIDLTNKIKRLPNGGFTVDVGPINCYCCCNKNGGK